MPSDTDIRNFSAFIFDLYERSQSQDSLALLEWSAQTLARATHADCAWSGWADLMSTDVNVCGAVSSNLPADFYEYWLTMKEEDLLWRDLAGRRRRVAIYDRYGKRQTEGMIAISDRYNVNKLSMVVANDPYSSISLFLSVYRGGRRARPMRKEEIEYLSAALNHLRSASARADDISGGKTPSLIVNERGRILTSSLQAKRILREWWPHWKSDSLPGAVIETLSGVTSSSFSRQGLSVEKRQIRNIAGPSLFALTFRFDGGGSGLTERELQIADKITLGLTHKEIARDLKISPATVRNHTQSVLTKLGARNKAAVSAIIQSSRHVKRRASNALMVHLH